jgi:ribose 1,5-bisphosphokinase
MIPRGLLVLVVGASGVGKDTLLAGARTELVGNPAFRFPKRWVTRPAEAGGEDHHAATEAEYQQALDEKRFLLAWRAHGLGYGVPADAALDLAAGRHVVVNVSRAVIDEARGRLAPVGVLNITASRESLADRLAARGRENEDDIARRLARSDSQAVLGADVIEVANDGRPEEGVAAFLDALGRAVRGAAPNTSSP